MEEIFKRMTMAFLHDPPCKPLDLSRVHVEIAENFMRTSWIDHPEGTQHLFDQEAGATKFIDNPDHAAAAADRTVFPDANGGAGGAFTGKFKHPLCDSTLELNLVSLQLAVENLQNAFGGIKADSWQDFFFLLWRQWRENTATLDRDMLFYPADTRIPDHSIWLHLDMTAAMEACRDEQTGSITPAFVLFQFGPVQEFIANARSTRDLWSGSYLIAWLTCHAIKAVTDEFGPTSVIFPSLRGQGVFDAVNKDTFAKIQYKNANGEFKSLWQRLYGDDAAVQRLLNPTIPNRFLALVPAGKAEEIARKAQAAAIKELASISKCCFSKFAGIAGDDLARWQERWNKQIELFPQITWQTLPFHSDIDTAIGVLEKIPNGKEQAEILKTLQDIAVKYIPLGNRDRRNYSNDEKNKLSRPEFAWAANFTEISAALAARRNTRDFQQFVTDQDQGGSQKDVISGKEEIIGDKDIWSKIKGKDDIFKKEEGPYSAINIIKRLWCRGADSYLCQKLSIDERQFRAALRYDSVADIAAKNDDQSPYVAVIALDGDKMGEWISGVKTPCFINQLSDNAKLYFEKLFQANKIPLSLHRPVTPGYHLQFSEALANFANFIAGKVVEKFSGQLIYAGGDDVLAMLPADKAIQCATALRSLFRGEENFGCFNEYSSPARGFVNIGGKSTLMVPGPDSDVSCGIAIAHQDYPLQSIVGEARRAESRAKNCYGRAAVAISLLKRGGEIIHWGAKWDSSAWQLYNKYLELDKTETISGKFASALAQLLAPYQLDKKLESVNVEQMKEIIIKEFSHVAEQQGNKKLPEELRPLAETYLKELGIGFGEKVESKLEDFTNLFLTASFIHRERD